MGNIDWIPIADMPEALKDGRPVLLANANDERPDNMMVGAFFDNPVQRISGWACVNYDMTGIGEPTHFAEINPPA